jgi:hypothetical protein
VKANLRFSGRARLGIERHADYIVLRVLFLRIVVRR